MKFAALSAVVAFALSVAAQTVDPSINTPLGVTQCQVSSLTFSGTHPPFLISVIPGGQAGSAPLEDIVTTSSSPYTWLCNLVEGSYITFQIRDSVGNLQYSAPVSVANSSNSSCTAVTPTASTISATGVISSASSPSSSPLSSGASTERGVSTAKPASGSLSSTAPPSSSTTSKSSATTVHAQWGIAGVLGLLGLGIGVLA